MMVVKLQDYPDEWDWLEVKRRALVTVGKTHIGQPPSQEWMHAILKARHSPIRYLRFSFYLEVPYYVSTHLARHVHAQPYIRSQRNDRQSEYDRNKAPQDAPVQMIWDMNAEELMTIIEKRICFKADFETQVVARRMANQVLEVCPEFKGLLDPPCLKYGLCFEMHPCGRLKPNECNN